VVFLLPIIEMNCACVNDLCTLWRKLSNFRWKRKKTVGVEYQSRQKLKSQKAKVSGIIILFVISVWFPPGSRDPKPHRTLASARSIRLSKTVGIKENMQPNKSSKQLSSTDSSLLLPRSNKPAAKR
jgi:hypothetical protein